MTISASTIDRALSSHKKKEGLSRKVRTKTHPLLYKEVPIKVFADQDRGIVGTIQIDLVEHSGDKSKGQCIYTVSTTDISTGWWEGSSVIGKGQHRVLEALLITEQGYPFAWNEIHSDNGTEFLNATLYKYTQETYKYFSRSRPYFKDDNCLVEQKNSTHVRRKVGYVRYDTNEENNLLNKLYQGPLRLYKNFFQPVFKLQEKQRVGARMKKKYDQPATPYHRTLADSAVSKESKEELKKQYSLLNPAQLKQEIDEILERLERIQIKKRKERKKNGKIAIPRKYVSDTLLYDRTNEISAT